MIEKSELEDIAKNLRDSGVSMIHVHASEIKRSVEEISDDALTVEALTSEGKYSQKEIDDRNLKHSFYALMYGNTEVGRLHVGNSRISEMWLKNCIDYLLRKHSNPKNAIKFQIDNHPDRIVPIDPVKPPTGYFSNFDPNAPLKKSPVPNDQIFKL